MGRGKGRQCAFGKKELKELYSSYGTEDNFSSGKFKPLTRNLTTGKILNRGHHCERCKAKMSLSCFDMPDPHYGFCPTWITRNGKRERCGERFAVHSDGCGKHSKLQGYNQPFYRAAAGEEVDTSEFDDQDPLNKREEQEDDDHFVDEMGILEEMEENYIAEHGELPEYFRTVYFEQRAIVKAYQKQGSQSMATSSSPAITFAVDSHHKGKGNGNGQGIYAVAGAKCIREKSVGRRRSMVACTVSEPTGKQTKCNSIHAAAPDNNNGEKDRKKRTSFAPGRPKSKLPIEEPQQRPVEGRETKTEQTKQFVQSLFGVAVSRKHY